MPILVLQFVAKVENTNVQVRQFVFILNKTITFRKIRNMINDAIAKFLEDKHLAINSVKIDFKKRNALVGMFLKSNDYEDLKSKNYWRVVVEPNVDQWKKTKDNNLAKIFHGTDFTKLSELKEPKS